jgi:hypothetical protein
MVDGGASNTACRKPNAQGVTSRWLQNSRKRATGAKNTIVPNRSASFAAPNASTSLWPLTKPKPGTSRLNRKSEERSDRRGLGGGVFRQPVKTTCPRATFFHFDHHVPFTYLDRQTSGDSHVTCKLSERTGRSTVGVCLLQGIWKCLKGIRKRTK